MGPKWEEFEETNPEITHKPLIRKRICRMGMDPFLRQLHVENCALCMGMQLTATNAVWEANHSGSMFP